jgi:hypothetical protein
MPPQEEIPKDPLEAPSVLHFTQQLGGMIQLTCLIDGEGGGWQLTSKCLWIENNL